MASSTVKVTILYMALAFVNAFASNHEDHTKSSHTHEHHDLAHEANRSSLNAHVHGLSEIRIAIENIGLEIEIESPAVDLVGFEHQALTKEDLAAVEQTKLMLSQYKRLFDFNGGDCQLISHFSDFSAIQQDQDNLHEHDTHHSEITVKYSFQCEQVQDLSTIVVIIFDVFANVNQINAMWVTTTEQNSAVLNATNNIIHLK